jgi:SAM-dependent methyltransferase
VANPGWYLDELAHAGAEHLDDAYVAGYEQKAGSEWLSDLALLRELGLGEFSTLVDLGAGVGALAVAAAPLCRRVVAVDVSHAMIAALRERASRSHLSNLEIVQQGLLSYEHRGEPADFVYSRHALHHLPDFWKVVALKRISDMLQPGGVLRLRDLIYAFQPDETERVIEDWLAAAADNPAAGWTRAELEEHLRAEYSTFTWLLEPMLERTGFEIREVEYSASRIFAAYVCVRR